VAGKNARSLPEIRVVDREEDLANAGLDEGDGGFSVERNKG
jgi:hypothetical protein